MWLCSGQAFEHVADDRSGIVYQLVAHLDNLHQQRPILYAEADLLTVWPERMHGTSGDVRLACQTHSLLYVVCGICCTLEAGNHRVFCHQSSILALCTTLQRYWALKCMHAAASLPRLPAHARAP